MSAIAGLRFDDGRVFVTEDGWMGLLDAAADPDIESFAAALGAPEASMLTNELHWSLRAHVQATVGVTLWGMSSSGRTVEGFASSDASRALLLLDTVSGEWLHPREADAADEKQLIPTLGPMLPVDLLDIMQVAPRPGLDLEGPVVLPGTAIAFLMAGQGEMPSISGAQELAVVDLLRNEPWRHWRVRATSQLATQDMSEDGLDIVVFADGMFALEALSESSLEVREITPVHVLSRLIEALRPGMQAPESRGGA